MRTLSVCRAEQVWGPAPRGRLMPYARSCEVGRLFGAAALATAASLGKTAATPCATGSYLRSRSGGVSDPPPVILESTSSNRSAFLLFFFLAALFPCR